jgi:hypothetical protein
VAEVSVNLKYSLVLTGMFRFKFAGQFVERYHSVVSRALNLYKCKFNQKSNVLVMYIYSNYLTYF